MLRLISGLLVAAAWMATPVEARQWTDSTGKYTVNAELVAQSETTVVLKKENHQLVAVPLAKLSTQDQEYLKSKEATDHVHRVADEMQTWTTRAGWKFEGKVVDYGRREVTVQRRRGKIYVNDRLFDNLPELYRKMLPKIVSQFEHVDIEDKAGLESWILKYKGEPKKFVCEGVVLELANGDEYGVPFFFFASDDLKVLKPGWEHWVAAADEKAKQEHQSFLLQSQAQAYQRDREASQQIATMQLEMTAYEAGLFDLWEVAMSPGPGVRGQPLMVVVPARDSRAAAQEASRRHPGFVPGAAVRVSRR
jgi:hypothetical protein